MCLTDVLDVPLRQLFVSRRHREVVSHDQVPVGLCVSVDAKLGYLVEMHVRILFWSWTLALHSR